MSLNLHQDDTILGQMTLSIEVRIEIATADFLVKSNIYTESILVEDYSI